MNILRYLSTTAFLLALLLASAFFATIMLRSLGATSNGLVKTAAFKDVLDSLPVDLPIEDVNSGTPYSLSCISNGPVFPDGSEDALIVPDWAKFRCDVRQGKERYLLAWFHFGEEKPEDVSQCGEPRDYRFSSQVWPYRAIFSDIELGKELYKSTFGHLKNIKLTTSEMVAEQELLGSIRPWCFLGERAAQISFNLEAPSIESIVIGTLIDAASLNNSDLPIETARRIAKELTNVLNINSGLFDIRQISGDDAPDNNMLRLLLTGWFEYVILTLGMFALGLSVITLSTFSKLKSTSRSFGRLSVRITGMLTYFGLLGTLYGVFGAVNSLSSVDFLNEFRKVFDQTASFGSMSLAIGTSVVGLGAAITVGLFQSFLAGAAKDDPFKE